MQNADPLPSVTLLGVRVHALQLPQLLELTAHMADDGGKHAVLYANAHVLNLAYGDARLRQILNRADMVICDGVGVELAARWRGAPMPKRITGADWIHDACAFWQARGLRIFVLGGKDGVARKAVEKLSAMYTGINFVGWQHGYQAQWGDVIRQVNETQPHILLLGLGTPLQEYWLETHRQQLRAPVVWTVGALFNYVAGTEPRAPRWMLDNGLEWLGRLWADPHRLWKRYLIGNPLFLWRVLVGK